MNILKEILKLPEGASKEQLEPLFERALACVDKNEVFEAFEELADRQWHTYEKLNSDIMSQVELWILDNWDRNSIQDAEKITAIVPRLGLESVFLKMKEELPSLPIKPKNEFLDLFEEVGDSVADPYDGIR